MDIIVTGHGQFASGIESTVKLLAGNIDRIHYIDFTEKMSDRTLSAEFSKLISVDKDYVFFCDLVGGTPYKEAVKISTLHQETIGVVAGCNIASLIEVGLSLSDKKEDIKQFTDSLIALSLKGTQTFRFKQSSHEKKEGEDGI